MRTMVFAVAVLLGACDGPPPLAEGEGEEDVVELYECSMRTCCSEPFVGDVCSDAVAVVCGDDDAAAAVAACDEQPPCGGNLTFQCGEPFCEPVRDLDDDCPG